MFYHPYNGKIDIDEIVESDLRKNVFREMARHFTMCMKEGAITDRPGTIARMMEAAFQAGTQMSGSGSGGPSRPRSRRFTDMDIPSLPRGQIYRLRLYLFGITGGAERGFVNRHEAKQSQLALIMRPKMPGMPSTISKDDWLQDTGYGSQSKMDRAFSSKVILPLAKLGLYNVEELNDGWRCATMTEWGFELLSTGETVMPDGRRPGASSTWQRYRTVWGDGKVVREAAVALGLLDA